MATMSISQAKTSKNIWFEFFKVRTHFKPAIMISLALLSNIPLATGAEPVSRYFHTGDGKIEISSARGSFRGTYKNADGSYNEASLDRINRVFGTTRGDPARQMTMRFIEFVDFISDHFGPDVKITVESGFRNPKYNAKLRKQGKIAAEASLHQYGMAADVIFGGVSSRTVWDYIREMGFGGAGIYGGPHIHVDVGPARFWFDRKTAKVDTDISKDNKRIAVVADKDIYFAGEEISLKFIAMTAFPIGVSPKFTLEWKTEKGDWKKVETLEIPSRDISGNTCPSFSAIEAMSDFRLTLPASIKPGRYRILAKFCEKEFDKMPAEIFTPEFEVR